MQQGIGGRQSELANHPGSQPPHAVPDPARVEDYVRRCLTVEFTEQPEARTYRSDPALASVLTPLNSQQFSAAVAAGRALLPRFDDFDLVYKWIGAAYRSTQQLPQAREILVMGLARAKRKSLLLTDLGTTEAQLGDLGSAVYWWSQAIHCLSLNPVDSDAYLELSCVANGFGLTDFERLLLARADSLRAGRVRLEPAAARRLTGLALSGRTESVRRVLDGLQFGYFASPAQLPPTLVRPPISGPPPGWYPDPTNAAALCWWDGTQWQPSSSHRLQGVDSAHGFGPAPSGTVPQPAVRIDPVALAAPSPVTTPEVAPSGPQPQPQPAQPILTRTATPPIQPTVPQLPRKRWPVIAGVGVLAVLAILAAVALPRLLPTNSAAPAPASTSLPAASPTQAVPVGGGLLTAGSQHSCRLTAAGGVLCWGSNGFGQLGDGTWTDRATPAGVDGLGEGVLSLGANGYHTCAVTDSGAVKCWGLNEHGQLGDGSTTGSLVPVDVVGLGAGIRSVAAGYEHTCAVTTAGAVKCWGANESGELGDGSTTDRLAPVDVQGLAADVVSVTAGGDYSGGQTCALMATGSIVCWGNNGSGQLGDGTTTNRSTPTTVTARGPGYQAVSAGDEHVCALTSEGEVQCWGENLYGQLGNGSTDDQAIPSPVPGLGSGVRALSAGGLHSCVVTGTSAALCWGDNEYGQLGDGTTGTRLTAVPVTGLTSGVRLVHAGEGSTCALTGTGVEQCWGDNEHGQLGNGTTKGSLIPVSVGG